MINSSNHVEKAGSSNYQKTPIDTRDSNSMKEIVTLLQQQAQEKFNSQNFIDSLSLYTKAIDSYLPFVTKDASKTPDADYKQEIVYLSSLFAQRGNVNLLLGYYRDSIDDVLQS